MRYLVADSAYNDARYWNGTADVFKGMAWTRRERAAASFASQAEALAIAQDLANKLRRQLHVVSDNSHRFVPPKIDMGVKRAGTIRKRNPDAPLWSYVDARGVEKLGRVEKTTQGQGTDVTYFFRSVDGTLDVVSGSRLKKARRVDNAPRSRKTNPVPLSRRASLKASKERFSDFRGDEPSTVRQVKVKVPASAMTVGELDGVLYTTRRDGKVEKYIHKFRKKSRPLLAASDDGNTLHIVGGRYEFTERGIVDK